jgi:hypothetical protein
MVGLLYICILPSPRVFFTSALAVQYPCFPHPCVIFFVLWPTHVVMGMS